MQKQQNTTAEEDCENALSQNLDINTAFDVYNTFLALVFKRKGSISTLSPDQVKQSKDSCYHIL